jgi:hypothetical protein
MNVLDEEHVTSHKATSNASLHGKAFSEIQNPIRLVSDHISMWNAYNVKGAKTFK